MKNIAFLIGGVFLFFSCVNEDAKLRTEEKSKNEEVGKTSSDSLPDAEWNGEYMKIKDGDEPKIKRKSQGSDFYSMGSAKFTIGENTIVYNLFERKKNVLTFTNQSITAFIKSAFDEDIKVNFKKNDIVVNFKGKYKADPSEKANNSFNLTINSGEKGQQKEYSLQNGEADLIQFSPRLGMLEMEVTGTFVDENGKKEKGEGTIKMNFEHAVMTAE